jgi:hypothetical protein
MGWKAAADIDTELTVREFESAEAVMMMRIPCSTRYSEFPIWLAAPSRLIDPAIHYTCLDA